MSIYWKNYIDLYLKVSMIRVTVNMEADVLNVLAANEQIMVSICNIDCLNQ